MMNENLFLVGFLCIFHIPGGAALGTVLRQLRTGQFGSQSYFFIIWGSGFGGIPLLIGAASLLPSMPLLFALELAVFVGTIVLVAFLPAGLLELFSWSSLGVVVFGALFFIVGAIIFAATWRESPFNALLPGALFMLIGVFALAVGVRQALKER